jgi:hypothetical protein
MISLMFMVEETRAFDHHTILAQAAVNMLQDSLGL